MIKHREHGGGFITTNLPVHGIEEWHVEIRGWGCEYSQGMEGREDAKGSYLLLLSSFWASFAECMVEDSGDGGMSWYTYIIPCRRDGDECCCVGR